MKRAIHLLLLVWSTQLVAQSTIQVGKVAPPIIITDWIANVPADKDLTSHPVLLNFWATWCTPCLAAVPNLNELQSQFTHTGLRFVSLTDESVDKVNSVLKQVAFKSIVAGDQSKKTQIAYGNGKTGLDIFPLTVFIDDKGYIRWIGDPNNLDREILQNLLDGNLPPANDRQGLSVTSGLTSVMSPRQASNLYTKIMRSDDINYHFEMYETKQSVRMSSSQKGRGVFFSASTLHEIWEAAFKVRPVNLLVPDSLRTRQYILLYKNIRLNENILDTLSASILHSVKLTAMNDTIRKMVYRYMLNDTTKLVRTTMETGMSGHSESSDKLTLNGYALDKAFTLINTQTKETFFGSLDVAGRFDFILNKASAETMVESLRSYGFMVTKAIEPIPVIRLIPKP
ncbi:MAG: TlpA family protein disulfide reductase [Cytophagales bacterium]|nr:MAG: TlpA family protein disulfide reductase [Cytophagales bacterium]